MTQGGVVVDLEEYPDIMDIDAIGSRSLADMEGGMGVRKPFDSALFKANDGPAREAVLSWLARERPTWIENPDPYGIDLLLKWNGRVVLGLEVERRHNWRSGAVFPFATIHVPARKLKYASLGFPTYFMATNRPMTHGLVLPFAMIANMASVEVRNKYVEQGEVFVDVPVIYAEVVALCQD